MGQSMGELVDLWSQLQLPLMHISMVSATTISLGISSLRPKCVGVLCESRLT